MKRYAKSAVVFLAGLMLWSAASGCSCSFQKQAGFIHAYVERLPSNARGALFLPPRGTLSVIHANDDVVIHSGAPHKLSIFEFAITSNRSEGKLPVQIDRLDPQGPAGLMRGQRSLRFARIEDENRFKENRSPIDWKAMLKAGTLVDITAAVTASRRLARIGPVGGFKPGVRYTITYTGPTSAWLYPAQVVHTIDMMPVRLGGAEYALALDGAPRRRPLSSASGGGECSVEVPATVQDFHYVLPAGEQRYASAMAYFSEFRTESEEANGVGGFEHLAYIPSNCSANWYGGTARGNGAELISAPCDAGKRRAVIRGWAGLLEVDERLWPTAIIQVDFANASGSCSVFGMLKQAVASRDASDIEETVCAAARRAQSEAPRPDDVPPVAELMALATSGSALGRSCAKAAITQLFIALPAQSAGFLEPFGNLLAADFLSPEADLARHTNWMLFELLNHMQDAHGRALASAPGAGELLHALLGALFQTLRSGSAAQSQYAGEQIASFGKWATPLVPELLALAGTHEGNARYAAHALTKIIPGDPTLHQILLRQARDPPDRLLRELATLDYDAVAGKSNEEQAIALLVDAVRASSSDITFSALGRHGRAARSSIPFLIGQMDKNGHNRYCAVSALLDVADGEPEVLAALAVALAGPDKELWDFQVASLARLNEKNRTLLPAIELRMQRPMSTVRQSGLEAVIRSMALPKAQTDILLERLARATLVKETYAE